MNKLRIELKEDALYVANTGQPFSATGVVSICRQNLSAKGIFAEEITDYDCSADQLTARLREDRLFIYRKDPNALLEDASSEQETSRDYEGRSIFELLQNADDAMAPVGTAAAALIGAKGLGFKAVLEISDTPEIHSPPFHFKFDAALSRDLLQGLRNAHLVGTFRLPHDIHPSRHVEELLGKGYTSVIRLPFRDAPTAAATRDRLAALPPHFLLLSQHLERVDIVSASGWRRTLSRQGERPTATGGTAVLRVNESGAVHSRRWRVWSEHWAPHTAGEKLLSAAIAAPLEATDEDAGAAALPLYVFYPTDDTIGAPFLIHAAFSLQQNRKHLRQGDHDQELLDCLARLVARMAEDLPAPAAARLLGKLARAAPTAKPPRHRLVRHLHYVLVKAARASAFVPVVGTKPRRVPPPSAAMGAVGFAALLNPSASGLKSTGLCMPEMEPVFDELSALGSPRLSARRHAELLGGARCRSIENVLSALNIVRSTCLGVGATTDMLEALAGAPIWMTEAGTVRALNGKPFGLAALEGWPDWAPVDVLHPLVKAIVAPDGQFAREWKALLEGRLARTPDEFVARSLFPVLAGWSDADWIERGWQALETIETFAAIDEWQKIPPLVAGDAPSATRIKLASVSRVPVGKRWELASQCYADRSLKASPELRRFFKGRPGRFVLGYPVAAEKRFSPARWRSLARYLGVSWEPKIRLFEDGDPSGVPSDAEFRHIQYRDSKRYREQDWFLEHFPECVAAERSTTLLLDMAESVLGGLAGREAEYAKQWKSRTHSPTGFKTFVHFQLRRSAFLPTIPSLLGSSSRLPAEDLYLPSVGLKGITPLVDLAGLKDSQRASRRALLTKELKVRSQLPSTWDPWLEWCEQLARAVANPQHRLTQRLVRQFYEAFLAAELVGCQSRKPNQVVAVGAPEGALRGLPAKDVAWIDSPLIATSDILEGLAEAGLNYLPALLDRGRRSPERLGVARASEVVTLHPRFEVEVPRIQQAMQSKLAKRARALAAVCEAKRAKQPAAIAFKAVRGLVVDIALSGTIVRRQAVPAILHEGEWLVNLDGDEWDGLAVAIAGGLGRETDLRYRFAALLRAGTRSDVVRILMADNIPEYRLREIPLDDDPPAPPAPTVAGGAQDGGADINDDSARAGNEETSGADASASPASGANETEQPGSSHLTSRPLYTGSGGGGSGGGGGGGTGSITRRAAEIGKAGEDWLHDLVQQTQPGGWTISRNERDPLRRETDLLLRRGGSEWHLEVKTPVGERLYWSDLERSKAEALRPRYAMALLAPPDGRSAYRLYWSWDPLHDLLVCDRRLTWRWALEKEGPPLQPDTWLPVTGVPEPHEAPNLRVTTVRLLESQLAVLPRDDERLSVLWKRIALLES